METLDVDFLTPGGLNAFTVALPTKSEKLVLRDLPKTITATSKKNFRVTNVRVAVRGVRVGEGSVPVAVRGVRVGEGIAAEAPGSLVLVTNPTSLLTTIS